TSTDIDSPQAYGVDISEKRKNFRSKLLILSNSADSLSSNQIDEYESMLADIENLQIQLRSKQYCTTARNLQARRRFLIERKTSITKKQHLKKPIIVENKKIIYAQWNSC
uniref:Uncharacterized protein n=1 Tax=Romanomermis culicivorax TaxID=13658 RepID=A0A915JY55_ROMCU